MVDGLGFGASPSQFYVQPAGDYREGLLGLGAAVRQASQDIAARTAAEESAAQEEAMRAEASRLFREGTPQEISEFAIQYPEWGQRIRAELASKGDENASLMVNMFYASEKDPSKMPMLLQAYEARLRMDGLTPEENAELTEAKERLATDPDAFMRGLEMSVAGLDPERYASYIETLGPVEEDLTTLQKEYKTAQAQGYKGSFMDYQRETNPTTAIQEYEYGVANPEYMLDQRERESAEADASAKAASYGSETALRKEFLAQSSDYQTVRDSYTRVLKSTEDPTPAGDLSLIFNYMKMLDPGSVVRESEFQTAASAGSYGDRIQAAVQRGLSGERLTDDMRSDFLNKSEALFKGMEEQHTKREDTYRGIAVNNGLNPDMVVTDIRMPITEEEETITAPGQNPTVGTQAAYDALPSGSTYINQNTGKLMRKP